MFKSFADELHRRTREGEGTGSLRHPAPSFSCTEFGASLSFALLLTRVFSVLVLELNCEFVGVKTVVICFEVDIIIRPITVLTSLADSDSFLVFFLNSFVNILT